MSIVKRSEDEMIAKKEGKNGLRRVADIMDKEHDTIEREVAELKKRFSYRDKQAVEEYFK
jgi:phage regulator Rha-like protein